MGQNMAKISPQNDHSNTMKVTILFPQIVVETKEVEIPDNTSIDELLIDETDFVWNNLTEQEKNWSGGKKNLDGAIEVGYCGIKKPNLISQPHTTQ
jgi:hypothetical protein